MLYVNRALIVDLVREADPRPGVLVSKAAFRSAVMGQTEIFGGVPASAIDAVFEEHDTGGAGAMSLLEIASMLNSGSVAQRARAVKVPFPSSSEAATDGQFTHAFRMQLDGVLIKGDEEALKEELRREKAERAKKAKALKQLDAKHENEDLTEMTMSAELIQARVRARRPPPRYWSFKMSQEEQVTMATPVVVRVRPNQRLDLMSAAGVGRLRVNAVDAEGRVLINNAAGAARSRCT